MSEFFSPYDADRPLQLKCSCGRDHSASEHAVEANAADAAKVLRARSMTSNIELCAQNSHPRDRLCDTLHPHHRERSTSRHRERSAAILRHRGVAAAPEGPRNDEGLTSGGVRRRCRRPR